MSDINLLVFGCVVTFIGVGGFYVYIRECFTTEERPSESEVRRAEAVEHEARDIA